VTSFRIIDTVQGALSGALPERLGASGDGGSTSFRMGGTLADGDRFIAWDTMQGSTGGQQGADGIDGCAAFAANLANVPVEVIESEFPVRIRRYGFEPDTGGGGEFRGGLAVTREWELLGERATVTIRADRERCPSWGIDGGEAGTGSRTTLVSGGEVVRLPAKVTREIRNGDVVRHTTAGAGGAGHPHRRPVDKVVRDWREGRISAAAARDTYGVVLRAEHLEEVSSTADVVDDAATRSARSQGGRS
jgi:N-methylhydantoinase B